MKSFKYFNSSKSWCTIGSGQKTHEAATTVKLSRLGSGQCLDETPSRNFMYTVLSSTVEERKGVNLIRRKI